MDAKENDLNVIPPRVTGEVKARSSIPWGFSHMSNKGGAVLALLDDFCDLLSLEPVYGCNLLFNGSQRYKHNDYYQ
jgi:hypothetical protein